jgi:signal transduction histidine kinase
LSVPPNPPEARSAPDGRSVAEVTALAGGLAHELRNPLSTMMVNLQLLAEDLQDEGADPSDTRRRALVRIGVVRREAERLQALFDEFLSLAGPCRLHRTHIDLRGVVRRLISFLEPTLKAAGITAEPIGPEHPVVCPVDEQLVNQALLNIVLNASDAMPAGGRLFIEVRREAPWATLAVRDAGTGIAPEDRGRIFDPFFSTKPKGTGLGLSVTERVIREHGGDLSFETAMGRGTTFTIRLPLDPTLPDEPETP